MPLAWLQNVFGHRVRLKYDSLDRPMQLVQELEERIVELEYGPHNLIRSVWFIGEHGNRDLLVRYEYDEERRLIAAFDALGQSTRYAYDVQHRLVRETNALGSSFHFHYDDRSRCVHTYGDGGYMERRLQYVAAPRSTRVRDGFGNLTQYILNAAGQVVQEVSPLGATTTTEFDEFGRTVSMTNAVGATMRYEYDAAGDRSAVVHEDGGRSEMTYNTLHLLETYTSPAGARWSYDFNSYGEVIGFSTPLGERQSAVRNDRGLVVETRSPTGVRTLRRYGAAMRWVEAGDDISLLSRTVYNARGFQIEIHDAQGLNQRNTYDAIGRPVQTEDRLGRAYRFAWNALGELTELSGPDVAWERRRYDAFGQLVEHVNAVGTLKVEYDREGRLMRVVNRAGEEFIWAYDADGRLVGQKGFDGRFEAYEYDPSGQMTRVTLPDGRWSARSYDVCGQMVLRTTSDGGADTFHYDGDGNLIETRNAAAHLVLERDLAGRVTAETQNGRRVEYELDADGDRRARRIAGLSELDLSLTRDARKRLVALADTTGPILRLAWDDLDRPIERNFAGNVAERLRYDTIGLLVEQQIESSQPHSNIQRTYRYDANDTLCERFDRRDGRSVFGHDSVGRLTNVDVDGRRVETYSYDPNGSIAETHRGRRTVGAGGCTFDDGERRYAYGLDGAIERIEHGKERTTLRHDVEGLITAMELPTGELVTYEYDPLGRRVAKTVGDQRTEFLWEGPVLAAEFRDGAMRRGHFVHGFQPMLQWDDNGSTFVVSDQAGLVRETFDRLGSLSWHGRFEAFGDPSASTARGPSPFAFRGQYRDDESGFAYNFYRYYLPHLADYSAPDPIGLEGGTQFYAYPRNPLQCDDPFGLKCNTSACGEKSMDGYFGRAGYKKVGSVGKNPNTNGIDAIYYKKGGKPPYIIAEAKNGTGGLKKDQMSDSWINSQPGGKGQDRIAAAFPPGSEHHQGIQTAAKKGDVATAVYNPTKDPKVTHWGTYGGENSTNPARPPHSDPNNPPVTFN